MILPSLRGYSVRLDDPGLRFMCKKCGSLRVLYRLIKNPMRQRVYPAYCLHCGDVVEIEVRVKT